MSGLVVVTTTWSNVLRIGGIMKLDVLPTWDRGAASAGACPFGVVVIQCVSVARGA